MCTPCAWQMSSEFIAIVQEVQLLWITDKIFRHACVSTRLIPRSCKSSDLRIPMYTFAVTEVWSYTCSIHHRYQGAAFQMSRKQQSVMFAPHVLRNRILCSCWSEAEQRHQPH